MPKIARLRQQRPARDRGGRPAVISREKVLEVARQLRSHELTMNAVAERLGVTKASLYYHFHSRQDLIEALGAQAARDLAIPHPDPANWRRWLEQAITGWFEMLHANPVFFELENFTQVARAGLPLQEAAMETLEEAGIARDEVMRIWSVTTSHAYVAATGVHEARRIDVARVTRELTQVLAEAERTRALPRVRSLVEQGMDTDLRRRFADTLAWLILTLPDPPAARRSKRGRS